MSRLEDPGERAIGTLYTWWRGDPLPALPPLQGLSVGQALDLGPVCQVSELGTEEAAARVRDGNVPYLASLGGRPACVGWSAHAHARIGELSQALELPPGNRYLWDFLTLPDLRGQGIYPRLLQAILGLEADATRFWIGHNAENVASGKGILKAGFGAVDEAWAGVDGLRFVALAAADDRARIAADLLEMQLADTSGVREP